MKQNWLYKLMVLMLVTMLTVSGVATAEDALFLTDTADGAVITDTPGDEGITADASSHEAITDAPADEEIIAEMVDQTLPAEGEITLDLPAEDIEPVAEAIDPIADNVSTDEPVAAQDTVGGAVNTITENTPSETTSEPANEVPAAFEAGTSDISNADAEQPTILPEAQPTETLSVTSAAEEVVVASFEESAKKAKNPFAPTAVGISAAQGTDLWIGMGPVQLSAVLQPADAQTKLKWKSSKKKIAKVNANGLVTPRKAGKSKITVTTGNKKKSSVRVTVRRNIVNNISAKPRRAEINSLPTGWDLRLKSVERTAAGKYVCTLYFLNGLGKSKRIENLSLQLYVGGELIAQKYVPSLRVASKKGTAKQIKVTFSGADLVNPNPILLPQYGAAGISISLMDSPNLVYVQPRKKSSGKSSDSGSSDPTDYGSGSYVFNKNTLVFHYANCSSVSQMNDENKGYSNDRNELISNGYKPCGRCNP